MKRSALLFGFLFFSTFTSHAAPFPRGLPSSQMEPQIGLYQNQEVGFRLESKGTDWTLGEAPKSAAGIEALYYAPEKSGDSRGLLTVRVDKNVEAADLKPTWTSGIKSTLVMVSTYWEVEPSI